MKQYAMIFIMLGVLVAVQMPTGAQPLAKFDFNEGSGDTTTDSVSGLVGTLGLTNPPDVSGAVVVNDDNPVIHNNSCHKYTAYQRNGIEWHSGQV